MAYSDEQIINALKKTEGNISAAARALGASRATIHKRINNVDRVKDEYDSVNEANLDLAENNLIDLIKDKDHKDHFGALKFYLRTKARERGYGDRRELDLTSSDGSMSPPKTLADLYDEERQTDS